VLGQIGDERAVKPLSIRLQTDNVFFVLLASYSALKKISGGQEMIDTVQLVRSAAVEIRHLYSRTRTVTSYESYIIEPDNYMDSPSIGYHEVEGSEPNPDEDGIRRLIELVPHELREQVRALCGEASYLFPK
jgi:hypothetical protein